MNLSMILFFKKKFFSGDERSLTVKKNAVFSVLLKCLSIVVTFLLVPLTIDYISAELYGVWLTLSSIVVWLGFLDVGFCQGLKNKLTEAIAKQDYERGKKLVSTTYFVMLVIFIPVCAIVQFVIPLIDWCSLLNVSNQYGSDIIKSLHVLVAICCLQQIINVVVSVVAAFQKVALSNSFTVVGHVLSLFVIIIMTKTCSASLFVLCFALAGMPVFVTMFASLFLYSKGFKCVRPSCRYVSIDLIKDLFSLGWRFFIINVQAIVLYQSTNILISNVSSPINVTSYNIAYKYFNVAMMFFTLLTQPLWPAYADAYARGEISWLEKTRKKMSKVFLTTVILCFLMMIVSPMFYHVWVGSKIHVPFTMTIVVMVYVILYCWVLLNGIFLAGISKVKLNSRIVLVGLVCHIPMAWLLGQYIGAYGVLTSMIIINMFYGIVYKIQVEKIVKGTATGIWNE